MRLAITLFTLSLLFACSHNPPAPECKIDAAYKSQIEANAGCFIQKEGKLLLIRQRNKSKLSFPGGTHDKNESAQCTAHRESWEEAGIDVTVGRTLHVFKNNFHLFECDISENIGQLKTNDPTEIIEVLWIDPQDTSKSDWRYEKQRALTIVLLKEQ